MRGYYKGAIRDKVLVDAQVEYRMLIWKAFGLTTWVETGPVARRYKDFPSILSLPSKTFADNNDEGLNPSYRREVPPEKYRSHL